MYGNEQEDDSNMTSTGQQGRRGFLFSIDALLGAMLLIGGFILITNLLVSAPPEEQSEYLSQDLLGALTNIKVHELNSTWVATKIADGTIEDPSVSVLEQIGTFWALNDTTNAEALTDIVLKDLIPDAYKSTLSIENDLLFTQNATNNSATFAAASHRMISGIAKGEILEGSTGSAFLRRIKDKRTSLFTQFGGFIGQGNLTIPVLGLPADANISNVYLEVDAGGPFNLSINGLSCGQFTPTSTLFTPDGWDISDCNTSFNPGVENTVTIVFFGDINESFIAGGFLEIRYRTDELSDIQEEGFLTHRFPGIDGIANLYDGFITPGTVTNMSIYLHFDTVYPTYLTIGGSMVYYTNLSGEQTVTLTDENLTTFPALLDYGDLSNTTVPVRFASYNESLIEEYGYNADIVLITDTSGSMRWRLDQDGQPGNPRACSNPDLYHKNDTQRLQLAKCVGIEFTEITMNDSPEINNSNRQWLVTFDNSADYFSNDLQLLNKEDLIDEINTYKNPSGGTCIACALNLAYNILDTYSNENRSKFVVLMTDGIPTWCTSGFFSCNRNGTGTWGTYFPWFCSGDASDCETGDCDGPIANAINASLRLYQELNASVYTIGMGPSTITGCSAADYLLKTIANETNASYYATKDSSLLRLFYHQIARDILLRTAQVSQYVTVQQGVAPSILYPDSYINVTYVPTVDELIPNELSITYQTPQFGSCAPSVEIFDGMRVIDAKLASYSDYHWTKSILVNGVEQYNLSDYGANYVRLGDPFLFNVLPEDLTAGMNSIEIVTGDSPENTSGCSANNSLILTVGVNISTTRSNVLGKKEGCEWEVEFEDDYTSNITIPSSYVGNNSCYYTNALIDYDPDDVYQVPVFNLLESLDFDSDGRVIVDFESEDLEIIVTIISQVPYLWGPSIAEMVVGR